MDCAFLRERAKMSNWIIIIGFFIINILVIFGYHGIDKSLMESERNIINQIIER